MIGVQKELTSAILVKDESVNQIYDSKICEFLQTYGFTLWRIKDYPICNWIYISLTDKTYMPGIPGIPITSALGNHAITIDEFYAIYSIFEKYEGLSVLQMKKEK